MSPTKGGGERRPWDELSKEEQESIIEARKARFTASRQEKIEAYLAISNGLNTAYRSAVLAVTDMAEGGEEIRGDKKVVVGHTRKNSRFFNFVTGKSKESVIPVPGWSAPAWVNGAIFEAADGLSLGAARTFAEEYNRVIGEVDENTKAVTM